MTSTNSTNVAAAIIAGGENSRMMGKDKCLLTLAGSSILDLILSNLTSHLDTVIINANGDLARFKEIKHPIISDNCATREGPLSGILTCMNWLQRYRPEVEWLLTTGSDTPFLPKDYVQKFTQYANGSRQVCIAQYQQRDHYLNGIWHLSLSATLQSHFNSGERSIKRVLKMLNVYTIDFSSLAKDPFFNINSPADYQIARDQVLDQ